MSGPSVLLRDLLVTFSNGDIFAVPVMLVANDRAQYYFGRGEYTSLDESLKEDTTPLFETDEYEIVDWFKNNMDWRNVSKFAIKQTTTTKFNYDAGFSEAKVEVRK